jgi:hypothetical protein
MTANPKRPPGDPMTLGNMRALGVQNLIASCLNDACRLQELIDVSKYAGEQDSALRLTNKVQGRAHHLTNKVLSDLGFVMVERVRSVSLTGRPTGKR